MPKIIRITPEFAVTAALAPEDFAEIARLGFRAILNNRPDGEAVGQLTTRREANLARDAGLAYRHVPAAKLELFDDRVLLGSAKALAGLDGPVLAHCASGLRSAIVWAATKVRGGSSIDGVLATLHKAGFDMEAVRDDLEAVSGGDVKNDSDAKADAPAGHPSATAA